MKKTNLQTLIILILTALGNSSHSANSISANASGMAGVYQGSAAWGQRTGNLPSQPGAVPQAQLTVTSSSTSLASGSTATLSTNGGSGTGAISFSVTNGSCQIGGPNGNILTANGNSCSVNATKLGDGFYASTSAVPLVISVYSLIAQSALNYTGPTNLVVGNNYSATFTGGGGTGAVHFSATGNCSASGTSPSISAVINAGQTCTLTIYKDGDATYLPSNASSVVLNIISPLTPTGISSNNNFAYITSSYSQAGLSNYQDASSKCQSIGAGWDIITYDDVSGNVFTPSTGANYFYNVAPNPNQQSKPYFVNASGTASVIHRFTGTFTLSNIADSDPVNMIFCSKHP
jgi:hypothetical protein